MSDVEQQPEGFPPARGLSAIDVTTILLGPPMVTAAGLAAFIREAKGGSCYTPFVWVICMLAVTFYSSARIHSRWGGSRHWLLIFGVWLYSILIAAAAVILAAVSLFH